MFTIVPYQSKYAQNFKELNLEWINKYFVIEEKDKQLLDDCEESILKRGGYIFIGLLENSPVGCFSYLKHTDGHYELGKMAVSQSHQGQQIGQKMLDFAINFAKSENWSKIDLYSSTKLDTALHIYKKFGFKEVPLEKDVIYLRSDIKMELTL